MNKSFLLKVGVLALITSIGLVVVNLRPKDDTPNSVIEMEVEENELDSENTYNEFDYEAEDVENEFEYKNEDENSTESNNTSNINNVGNNKPATENTESSSTNVDNSNSSSNTGNSSQNSSSTSNSSAKTGSFEGFADDNFVEVKIGNDYATYRVSTEAKNVLSGKNIGDSISFEITTSNGQSIITSVK